MKRDVIGTIREELGLRNHRVRYGHTVRLINQLLRMIYCEKKLEQGEQYLTHVMTDESYIQLGKNSRTCFVKSRHDAVHPAPKHVPKVIGQMMFKKDKVETFPDTSMGRHQCTRTLSNQDTKRKRLHRGLGQISNDIGREISRLEPVYKNLFTNKKNNSSATFGNSAVLVQDWAPAHSSRSTSLYMNRSAIQVLTHFIIFTIIF